MSNSVCMPQVTRRNFLRGVGLLSATSALAACMQEQDNVSGGDKTPTPLLAIIHTNDTHGHDLAVEADEDTEGNFSMAALPALKAEWEDKGYEVVLVDAGDASQGTPLVDTSDGSSAISFMNACGYDLMTVGNHEFDWGMEKLEANRAQAHFPLLSANVLDKDTGERHFEANKIIELSDGTKVGFFGLTTPATLTTTSPKNIADLEFLSDDELHACAQEQVDELRAQGCELVVCVGHLGNGESIGNKSRDLLEQVQGIDLFIDGHDHKVVEEEVAGTLLVETGCYLHNIGVVAIEEGVPSAELVAAGSFEGVDESVQVLIEEEDARVSSEMNVVLGSTSFLMNGERNPGVRTQETNLGDFCADAALWTAGVELETEIDAAVITGGGIRVSIEPGDITLGIIKTVSPFGNEVVVIKVTGAQLLEALEAACQAVGKETPIGAFPQVSGITFSLDASVPYEEGPVYPDSTYHSPAAIGSRVTISDVAGRGFDEGETYTIATTDFLAAGGDTYYTFREAAEVEVPQTAGFDYEALMSYLVEACDHVVPERYAEPQGRITITGVN